MECGTALRKSCAPHNYGLTHEEPYLFMQAQTGRSVVYVIYRWVVALLFVGNFILSLTRTILENYADRWLIFLTIWGLVFNTVTSLWRTGTSTAYYVTTSKANSDEKYKQMYWYLKVQWVLYNLSCTCSFVVTVAFWALLYRGQTLKFVNIANHGLNSLLALIDVFVTATPVRYQHFYQVVICGLVYSIFSVIYWAAGGVGQNGQRYIYPVLDWGKDPWRATLTCAMVLFATALFHFVLYGLYRLRLFLYRKWQSAQQVSPLPDEKD